MLSNYLEIAFRILWKNRLFTIINVLGLSIGLACVVVLILFAQKCLTWDTQHNKIDQIYYVQTQNDGNPYNQTVYPLLNQMLHDYPEIETGTHVQYWTYPWIEYKSKSIQDPTIYVDSTYFQIFTFPFKYGTPNTALVNKRSIVLSEQASNSLFGDINPIGKYLTVSDSLQFTVTGVLKKLPSNTTHQFDVLMPISNLLADQGFRNHANWFNTFTNTFVLLKKGAEPSQLEVKLSQLINSHFKESAKNIKLRISPFKNFIYVENPVFEGLINGSIVIAILLLFIVCVNLINLNTALALARVKEVAMRMILGASRKVILNQFWVESGIMVTFSIMLSVLFAIFYLIPSFNQLRGVDVQLDINLSTDYPTILIVFSISILVALLSGTYPALYLMGLPITDATKGKLTSQPKQSQLRQNVLTMFQFTLAIILIICTIGMREQLKYMKEAKLGYDSENLLVFKTDLAFRDRKLAMTGLNSLFEKLRHNSNVTSFTSSNFTPLSCPNNYNQYYPDGLENQKVRLRHMSGAVNFTETLKIPMVEGRNFSASTSVDSINRAVIINESAMRAFGWKTAVNRKLHQLNDSSLYTIIGVMKDYHYSDLSNNIEPMLQAYNGPESLKEFLIIRINSPEKAPRLFDELNREFMKFPSRRSLSYSFLTTEIRRAYRPLDNIWRMISFVTIITILTACGGIFGLATLTLQKRFREVGIRKVLGASNYDIVVLFARKFLVIVSLAIIIASPIGWILGKKLLNYFAYSTQIQWWYFALSGLLAIGIALITVSFQSIKAVWIKPLKALQNE